MKYQTRLIQPKGFDLNITALKADEFLKEYWGQEIFYIAVEEQVMENKDSLYPPLELPKEPFTFFAFRETSDFDYLRKNNYKLTPERQEVFQFIISSQIVDMFYYNSFSTNERDRQFLKITGFLKNTLTNDYPLFRIRRTDEGCMDIMCKYRRSEGRIGFSFTPYIDDEDYKTCKENLWVYQSDFQYLYPFIQKDDFDYTSDNDISKEEWTQIIKRIKEYKTDDLKVIAFLHYIIDWVEEKLTWANYIELFGNL